MLDCPFYARDENGGMSRDFTPCFGDVMAGDFNLPYTCGSKSRRSIIKYFFRNYSSITNKEGLSQNISSEILKKVNKIYLEFISDNSKGCLNLTTQ
jgi:hypothetical protein